MKKWIIGACIALGVLVLFFAIGTVNYVHQSHMVNGVFMQMKADDAQCRTTLRNGRQNFNAKEFGKKLDNIDEAVLPGDFRQAFHHFRDCYDALVDSNLAADALADMWHGYKGTKGAAPSLRAREDALNDAVHHLKQAAAKYGERFTD